MAASNKRNEKAESFNVELLEGKGKGNHAFYWHVYANGVRAGQVYIDYAENEILGRHSSIHIFLNKKSQGKGIGRIAYKMACEKSGLKIIYAHMRKNNIASQNAASVAGFVEVKNKNFSQLVMKWEHLKFE